MIIIKKHCAPANCIKPAPYVPRLDGALTSDTLTAEMKELFQLAFQENPNKSMTKNEVHPLVRCPDGDLFGWLDLGERSGQSIFGKKLREFTGCSLGGMYLQIDNRDNRRPRYRFTQETPPIQENMAAAVLGFPQTPCNQEDKCQPCQPLQALRVFLNPLSERERFSFHPACPALVRLARRR